MTPETKMKNSRATKSTVKAAEPNNDTAVQNQPGATKESRGPAAPTKAPAKKTAKPAKAAKAESNERRSAFANDSVITVLKAGDHGLKGKRGAAIDAMKNGMTVEQYKTTLEKKDLKGYAGAALTRALALKAITVKG
jgi:hypothetical protein